jgi:beta-lactamase regulating signal transducer with metallopeptidase domain
MIDLLNAWGHLWFERFALIVLQDTVFLGLIFLVLARLRSASARLRYGIALVGLVKLILPPFVPLSASTGSGYLLLVPMGSRAPQILGSGTGTSVDGPLSLSVTGALFALWSAVGLGILARTLFVNFGLHLEFRRTTAAEDDDAQRFTRNTGLHVRVSERAAVPLTIGIFPRTILVPPDWSEWSSHERGAVLRHELAHIRRRDGLVRAVETLVQSAYWFHPLVLMVIRRIDVYREQTCDEEAAGDEPRFRLAYAQFLVQVAQGLLYRNRIRGASSAMVRRHRGLLGRVQYLLREEPIMSLSRSRAIVLGAALSAAILSLSWYQSSATLESNSHDEIDLVLTTKDQVVVDGERATLESLGAMLARDVDTESAIVRIECAQDVPMRTVFQAHAALRRAGLLKVSYAQTSGKVVPLVLPSEELIEKAKSIPSEHIARLAIRSSGSSTLDGVELEHSQIRGAIAQRLAEDDMLIVSVRMAEDATFGQYVSTLEALEAAGARRIFIEQPATP